MNSVVAGDLVFQLLPVDAGAGRRDHAEFRDEAADLPGGRQVKELVDDVDTLVGVEVSLGDDLLFHAALKLDGMALRRGGVDLVELR